MNERIKELAEQATIKTSYQYRTWGDRIATETKEVFSKEKFAELIIKECAHIAWLNSTEDNISHTKIKEYFGVEE
jgi:hypothetical protein